MKAKECIGSFGLVALRNTIALGFVVADKKRCSPMPASPILRAVTCPVVPPRHSFSSVSVSTAASSRVLYARCNALAHPSFPVLRCAAPNGHRALTLAWVLRASASSWRWCSFAARAGTSLLSWGLPCCKSRYFRKQYRGCCEYSCAFCATSVGCVISHQQAVHGTGRLD